MRNEAMAAIPAVWLAVAMCPVVQKEIAKLGGAEQPPRDDFRNRLAHRDTLHVFPGPSPASSCGPCIVRFSDVITWTIKIPVVIALKVGEIRGTTASWLDLSSIGPTLRSTDDDPNR
jgi:hypothetical protein